MESLWSSEFKSLCDGAGHIDGIQHLAHMTAVACREMQPNGIQASTIHDEQGVTLSDYVRDLQPFAAWVAHTYGHSEVGDGYDGSTALVLSREDF